MQPYSTYWPLDRSGWGLFHPVEGLALKGLRNKRLVTRLLYPSINLHTWPIMISYPTKTKTSPHVRDHFISTNHFQLRLHFKSKSLNTTYAQFRLATKLWPISKTTLGVFPTKHKLDNKVINTHLNKASHWTILREHGPTEIGDLLTHLYSRAR